MWPVVIIDANMITFVNHWQKITYVNDHPILDIFPVFCEFQSTFSMYEEGKYPKYKLNGSVLKDRGGKFGWSMVTSHKNYVCP